MIASASANPPWATDWFQVFVCVLVPSTVFSQEGEISLFLDVDRHVSKTQELSIVISDFHLGLKVMELVLYLLDQTCLVICRDRASMNVLRLAEFEASTIASFALEVFSSLIVPARTKPGTLPI